MKIRDLPPVIVKTVVRYGPGLLLSLLRRKQKPSVSLPQLPPIPFPTDRPASLPQSPLPLPQVNDPNPIVEQIAMDFLKNLAISAVKSCASAVVAGLVLFLSTIPPSDPIGQALFSVVAVGVRALISALDRFAKSQAVPLVK